MKPVAVPVDGEIAAKEILKASLLAAGETPTVAVGVPATWTKATGTHVQVSIDGTPEVQYPVLFRTTVRVTVWAASTTEAKRLASLCLALLASYEGDRSVMSVRPLTGVLPARDPATKAELASVTVQMNLRGTTPT